MRWDLILPNPLHMAELFCENPLYYIDNWWSTLWVSAAASLLSLLMSFVVAVAGLRFPFIARLISPITALSQSFPLQAIAPLIIIALGVGFHSKLAIASLISFFPIYISMASALQHTPKVYLAYLKVTKASFWGGVRFVRLPIALPAIVAA
jgi:ABC-type nitrate/sulfonate/bicarbonate transport system permease component